MFFYFYNILYNSKKQCLYKNSHKVAREHTISKNVLGFCYIQFSKDVLKSMVKCRHCAIFYYLW